MKDFNIKVYNLRLELIDKLFNLEISELTKIFVEKWIEEVNQVNN